MRVHRIALAAALGLMLAACTPQPVQPNQVLASTAIAIKALATEIGTAQQLGQITVEQEDAMLDRLEEANNILRRANVLANTGGDATSLLDLISQELTALRIQMAREATE